MRVLRISDYFSIQDKLNEFTVENWKSEMNQNHYLAAMFEEFGEILGSVPWKWWKNGGECDYWNLKIEAIDVLHFALSFYILRGVNMRIDPNWILAEYNTKRNYMVRQSGTLDHNVFVNRALGIMTSDNVMEMNDFLDALGLNAEETSAIYTAKSELNFIRQESGYKDGTYVKIVDGKEDNERLQEVVEDFLENQGTTLDDLRVNVRHAFFEGI